MSPHYSRGSKTSSAAVSDVRARRSSTRPVATSNRARSWPRFRRATGSASSAAAPPASRPSTEVRRETEALVERLVETHGVSLETPRGDFVHGSFETYRATLVPMLAKALEAKGYLPFRESSPWKSAWQKAMYHMRLEVSERREGNYLSTENRLTRIEARLSLTSSRKLVWQTIPTARTTVPLPNLPVFLSSRLASRSERTDECEHLLYENARGQIDEKFGYALSNLPACCP